MDLRMRHGILALGAMLGLLAAPLLGAAGPETMPCCPESTASPPCASEERPCPSMAPMPCCEAAPVAPASVSQGPLERHRAQVAATLESQQASEPNAHWYAARAMELSARVSPLRLSVVLRI